MSVGFDPGTDFEDVTDGLEAVTLTPRFSSSTTAVTKALQRAVTTAEVQASDGKYLASDVRWHLPVAEVSSRPALGTRIVDDGGTYWIILDVQQATLSSRWRCICRNPAIAFGLDDTITIEVVAAYTKGDGGAPERTWKVWKAGVRARIQPVAMDVADEQGAQRTTTTYSIFVVEDFEVSGDYAITHNHRIKDAKGTYYRITGFTDAEDIGGLQTIHAEEAR